MKSLIKIIIASVLIVCITYPSSALAYDGNASEHSEDFAYVETLDDHQAESFEVEFFINGELFAQEEVLSGEKANQVSCPHIEGYSFDGWYYKYYCDEQEKDEHGEIEERYDFETPVYQDIRLYGYYNEIKVEEDSSEGDDFIGSEDEHVPDRLARQLTFILDGNVICEMVVLKGDYIFLEEGIVPDEYSLKEWNTDPDGMGQSYKTGEEIYITGDITLYAIASGNNSDVVSNNEEQEEADSAKKEAEEKKAAKELAEAKEAADTAKADAEKASANKYADDASKAAVADAVKAVDAAVTSGDAAKINAATEALNKAVAEANTKSAAKAEAEQVVVRSATLPLKFKQKISAGANLKMAPTDQVVSVVSSNTKAVTVTGTNIKAGKKKGTSVITVTMKSGQVVKYKVKVQKTKAKGKIMIVCPTKITLTAGKKVTIGATKTPASCTDKFKYTSSKKKVATVSKTGVITAKAVKKTTTVTITVKLGKTKKKIKVTVMPKPKA